MYLSRHNPVILISNFIRIWLNIHMSISSIFPLLKCSICSSGTLALHGEISCPNGHVFQIKEEKVFFTSPPEDIKPTVRAHAKSPSHWTTWRRSNYSFFEKILHSLDSSTILLDLGTGQGQFSNLIKRFPILARADFYPYPDANVICDFPEALPFKDDSFNLIIASNVLEHVPNTGRLLTECTRVLKPGGQLVATIPFLLQVHQEPYDFHRYTYIMLHKLLVESGYSDIKIVPLTSPAETYAQIQLHFFQHKFATKSTFSLKIFWMLQRLLNRLFQPLLAQGEPHLGMTIGYGISASIRTKPSITRDPSV